MDSLQTYGTVDMYGNGESQDSDSRRLLSNIKDHCSTCEKKFSDPNTCVNSCSSHIKLEKTGFSEIFHECCQKKYFFFLAEPRAKARFFFLRRARAALRSSIISVDLHSTACSSGVSPLLSS